MDVLTSETPVLAPTATLTLASPLPHFKTDSFEGPLDLLLHLIRANEVDISDIPIAEITTQYLAYIEMMEAMDLTIAGEYLVIAATLIEIKSRLLLPLPPPQPGEEEAEDPRAELVARLREYELYRGTVETFRVWEDLRRLLYFRGALENADDYILPVPQGEATAMQLHDALHRMLMDAGVDDQPVTTVTPRRRLSIRMKMAELLRRINHAGVEGLPFDALFDLPCPRYDIVLAFLALLEILRVNRATAQQKGLCETIWIHAVLETTPPEAASA